MFKKVFVRGLLTVLPITITLIILVWLFKLIDRLFGKISVFLFGPKIYFPGLGLIMALVLIFLVGLIMSNRIMQGLYTLFEKILDKMPLVKTIYRSIDDVTSFFKQDQGSEKGSVVIVDYNDTKLLGFASRDSFSDLPQGIGREGDVVVYLPMSYQMGGYAVIVPKTRVHKIDMSMEDALRFAATAGMENKKKTSK